MSKPTFKRTKAEMDSFESNSKEMIELFIELFDAYRNGILDIRDVEFDGDGSYFGKQVSIEVNRSFGVHSQLNDIGVEVAYNLYSGKIVIYTSLHGGFWAKPYIELDNTHSEYGYLAVSFRGMLKELFGL